jgi:hypothetical protein
MVHIQFLLLSIFFKEIKITKLIRNVSVLENEGTSDWFAKTKAVKSEHGRTSDSNCKSEAV